MKKNFNFKFVLMSGSSINVNESGENLGDALNKLVERFGLENETFGMKVTPLSTIFVPKGQFLDRVV